ncbi:MAG: MFS transporter [Chthonomonadaceae bacterium]|nr:MFS transporter [Chthonomonadaceae bacterium]
MVTSAETGYRNTWLWNIGFSAYWFSTHYKWFILLSLVLPAQVARIVPGGEKNSAWGTVYAIGAVWGAVGPALFGAWSDRFDSKFGHRQPFIVAGALVTVLAIAFMIGANSIPLLVIGYLLLQLGEDIGQGPYAAMMPEIVPPENSGKASAVMNLLQSAARLISGLVYLLINKAGAALMWSPTTVMSVVYGVVALVQVLGAGTTVYTVRHVRRRKPVDNSDKKAFLVRWLAPWKSADFRWVWITRFMSTFAFSTVSTYFLFYLTDMFPKLVLFGNDLKDPHVAVIVIVLAMSLLGIVGAWWSGMIADRVGRKKLILMSGIAMSSVLVPFALARDFTFLFVLVVPFGVAFGIYVSADWALAMDVLPDKDDAGTQMGVWSMSSTSVQIFAGLAGPLIDFGNRISFGWGYMGMIWSAGVVFLVSTLLIRKIKGSF